MLAASVRALLGLFEGRFLSTVKAMRQAIHLFQSDLVGPVALELLYTDLEPYDFSRDVLEHHDQMLQVLRVPNCGWTDLGTPKRVAEAVRAFAKARSPAAVHRARFFDLATSEMRKQLLQAS
jgi:mannose-1-phosphate guanylyltransferase